MKRKKIGIIIASSAIIGILIVMVFTSTPVTIMPIDGSVVRHPCVSEKYYCYTAENVTVNVGDVVRFFNPGPGAHTFVAGNPDNGLTGKFGYDPPILLQSEESFDWIPHTAGKYEFFNMLNPLMQGVITVVGESIEPEPKTFEEALEIARKKIILTSNTWENFPSNFTINSR